MNKPILTLLVLAILTLLITFGWLATRQVEEVPDDLQAYLWDTHEFVERGEYATALERYVWFHENVLDHAPSMSGVRLSFALSAWHRLAEVYPPAMEALIDTRDRQVSKIRSGAGYWEVFSEVESINGKLNDQASTVELFEYLHDAQPTLAKRVWRLARSDVIAAGKHELAMHYIGNPMHAQAAIRRSYDRRVEMHRRMESGENLEIMLEFAEDRFVEQTLELMQVLSAVDRHDLARQIGETSLETVNDPRIEFALQ